MGLLLSVWFVNIISELSQKVTWFNIFFYWIKKNQVRLRTCMTVNMSVNFVTIYSWFFVPVPKTAVEVDGLSICELCTASIMVIAGSWLVCCWVGWTKAVAWLCCRLRIGCVVCMLGLVERTEPLVLPKTITCSIGPSVDWRADGTNQWQFTTCALI